MNKKLINYLGLTGLAAFLSYAAAVIFSPLAFPGYDRLAQAVSDLSAQDAPSRMLWERLSAVYNACSVVCVTCVCIYVSQNKCFGKLMRIGIYLFSVMNWISKIGYSMFPLADSGKEIKGFQEVMHIVVTVPVVMLSIVSLVIIIIAGFRKNGEKALGICALIALLMMFVGAIGTAAVPKEYFGVTERFSLFSAVGFNAVLGLYLFKGDKFSEGSANVNE